MKVSIVKIGNSRGFRVPKKLLEETKLIDDADMSVEKGALVIRPLKPVVIDESVLLSYSALAEEWDSPEDEAAWAKYQ